MALYAELYSCQRATIEHSKYNINGVERSRESDLAHYERLHLRAYPSSYQSIFLKHWRDKLHYR